MHYTGSSEIVLVMAQAAVSKLDNAFQWINRYLPDKLQASG